MYEKLAAVELVKPRSSSELAAWLNQLIEGRKTELKAASVAKLNQTRDKLLAYFDPSISIRKITVAMAEDWRQWLTTQGISDATVKTHCGNAKTLFEGAIRREIIERNPFASLSGGRVAAEMPYIDEATIEKVIEACPDSQWRLLFGLTRYAGLRSPSETHLLTWSDIDWQKCRLHVRSPKTERYAGKESRIVPICPRLMELLQERFDEAEEGDQNLVSIKGKGAQQRRVDAICKAARVERWPRLWQTLRASCERWWAMEYPQYAVSKWIGHSITISGKHYANSVPDELFDKAAQNPAQSGAALSRTESHGKDADSKNPQKCGAKQVNATECEMVKNGAGGSAGSAPHLNSVSHFKN